MLDFVSSPYRLCTHELELTISSFQGQGPYDVSA